MNMINQVTAKIRKAYKACHSYRCYLEEQRKIKKHQEEQAAELEEKRIVAKGTARKKETIHSMESKAKVLTEVHKEMKTSADAMLKEANERLKKAIKKNDPIEIKKIPRYSGSCRTDEAKGTRT
ncbi:hypothetical protein JTE90_017475 [Oedothorax gibbosus]|uniref:Uncharacterized protein n=1 Tax=Oedothorax gibbosus TaxID=931172 RepID=A0AAV6UAH0_9ARAC|nr:hypothetical protein JTE90_017475 [Oedothorax gibbosus]